MHTAIENIGQLVTCRPDGSMEVLEDCSIVFEGAYIARVGGPTAGIEAADAEGGVVMPGFIDAHTHLVFGGHRASELEMRAKGADFYKIKEAGGGIMSTVRQTRTLDSQGLLASGLTHLSWALRCGSTTWEAKSGYGLDSSTELDILLAVNHIQQTLDQSTGANGIKRMFPTFLGLHSVPDEANSKEEYVNHMVDIVLPAVVSAGLADYADAFVEKGYFDANDARKLSEKCKEVGLGLRLHVDQMVESGGAELAAELGAVTADHLEHTGASGIAAMHAAGTIPVLLPGSVFGLGLDRYPDARAMIEQGLPVVLATDFNPGTSPTPSIPLVMALACRYMKMTPEECLAATTVNAARSLGLADRGRLVPGQLADLSLWALDDWRETVQWIDGPKPVGVWLGGSRVL